MLMNIFGLTSIIFIACWFWLFKKTSKSIKASGIIDIKVKDGVYQPATISVSVNQPITLRFIREDATPCAEFVVFSQLDVNKKLPLNKPIDIMLKISTPGEYDFTCQMGMYRGKIIVT